MIIAIDPGTQKVGWATYDPITKRLLSSGVIVVPKEYQDDLWLRIKYLCATLEYHVLGVYEAVIESQFSTMSKGDTGMKVSWATGAIGNAMTRYGLSVITVDNPTWKNWHCRQNGLKCNLNKQALHKALGMTCGEDEADAILLGEYYVNVREEI